MINLSLHYPDGRIGVMQYFGEDSEPAIMAAIRKMPDQPSEARRITEAEADAIRNARPAVEEPEPLTAVKVDLSGIEARLADISRQIEAIQSSGFQTRDDVINTVDTALVAIAEAFRKGAV